MIFFSLFDTKENPSDSSDLEIVRRVKSGDDSAFEEIVDKHGRLVYNAVCRVLTSSGRSTDQAEELAEDAFVKAWQSISLFRGGSSLSTWLYRIAVNTAKDALRAEKRHAALSLSAGSDDGDEPHEWDIPVTSGDTVPEDAIERKETILAVRRAVESLPEDARRVVVMRDISGMAYTDIADALGIELGTVKSRLSRGRAMLKKILTDGNFI